MKTFRIMITRYGFIEVGAESITDAIAEASLSSETDFDWKNLSTCDLQVVDDWED